MSEEDDVRVGDRNSLCGVITCVREFADPEYQQRVWVNGRGPECSSFVEAICGLFDDYRVEEFTTGKARDYGFSEEMLRSLSLFVAVLDKFSKHLEGDLSDAEIIKQNGWADVVAMASRAMDSGVVDWARENCDVLFPIHWRGRVVGE